MGKWARKRRTGSNAQYGMVSPPTGADMTIGAPATPSTPITRVTAQPPGTDQWSPRAILVATGAVTQGGISAATPIGAPTAAAATTYKIQVAYYLGTLQVSAWATLGTITTP